MKRFSLIYVVFAGGEYKDISGVDTPQGIHFHIVVHGNFHSFMPSLSTLFVLAGKTFSTNWMA